MVEPTIDLFQRTFNRAPEWVGYAPGRVNLIGDHTDYQAGLALSVATTQGTAVALSLANGASRLVSDEFGPSEEFNVDDLEPGSLKSWGRYPAGAAAWLAKRGTTSNFLAAVKSDLPSGSGLSSSAALTVASTLGLAGLFGQTLTTREAAVAAQWAEHEFANVPCGLLDQTTVAEAVKDHALFIDFETMETEPVPWPDGLVVVVCDTGKPRELAASSYAKRRQETEEAARLLGLSTLREATPDRVQSNSGLLGEVLSRRALHVVQENVRVRQVRQALEEGSTESIRGLFLESHVSLRNLFEVSCIELDTMVESCQGFKGCLGARMTGGGFGGAAVALVCQGQASEFVDHVSRGFGRAFPGLPARLIVTGAARAAIAEPVQASRRGLFREFSTGHLKTANGHGTSDSGGNSQSKRGMG